MTVQDRLSMFQSSQSETYQVFIMERRCRKQTLALERNETMDAWRRENAKGAAAATTSAEPWICTCWTLQWEEILAQTSSGITDLLGTHSLLIRYIKILFSAYQVSLGRVLFSWPRAAYLTELKSKHLPVRFNCSNGRRQCFCHIWRISTIFCICFHLDLDLCLILVSRQRPKTVEQESA